MCGNVAAANALSSNPGRSLPGDAAPNSQPESNETVLAAGPGPAPAAARSAGVRALSIARCEHCRAEANRWDLVAGGVRGLAAAVPEPARP
ncbi:MAG TPA: hypothetical protein VHY31_27360, partial [Streptosporangiaceae bacterium]|nr:hypothetical protein [Streptosporangiaceae bacterium]